MLVLPLLRAAQRQFKRLVEVVVEQFERHVQVGVATILPCLPRLPL